MEEVKWDILFCIYCNGFDFRLLYFSFNEKCQLGKPSLFKKRRIFYALKIFPQKSFLWGKYQLIQSKTKNFKLPGETWERPSSRCSSSRRGFSPSKVILNQFIHNVNVKLINEISDIFKWFIMSMST